MRRPAPSLAARLGRGLARRRRGEVALEAVLALPVLVVLFGAVAQVLILSQSRVYVEQAAYAAARAALVHRCEERFRILARVTPVLPPRFGACTDNPQAWEDAARWALVAAAPTSGAGNGACPPVEAAIEMANAAGGLNGRETALRNALCYVWTEGNVTVTADWAPQSLSQQLFGGQQMPVEATVTFRYPLNTPFARFLRDGEHPDGTYWREASATVVLM